jgi:electron transport complex protein RnfG
MTAPQQLEVRRDVPAWRLLVTLSVAGGLAGLVLVFVYQLTLPMIEHNKAVRLAAAVEEVLKAPYRYDTLYVLDGALTAQLPAGTDPKTVEAVYVGYTEDDVRIGFAITRAEAGFADLINVIFGYDHATGTVLGMKVLESKETPGLGDKIEKDMDFVTAFDGVSAPIEGVKAGDGTGDPHEVDLITGATISSRTLIRIINNALERLGPMLDSYLATATASATAEAVP